MVKYGIWRPGKPAFRDAGLESRNARLSRPVISYAQYQMAPLVITQCSSSSPPPTRRRRRKVFDKLIRGGRGQYRPLVVGTQPKAVDEEQEKSSWNGRTIRQGSSILRLWPNTILNLTITVP